MFRSLVIFFALCLVVSALALPSEVARGHYPSRSGDFILKHKEQVPGKAFLTLIGKDVDIQQSSLAETSVGDLVSYFMGVPLLNPASSLENFPRVNFLERPRANILFFVESSQASGKVALTSESYPFDSIARLTSILTGATPSEHGIVQRAWYDQLQGEIVTAYSSDSAGARVASLQDIVTAAFAGNSLVVSAATCRMVATALAAKSVVLPDFHNNHALYWDADARRFASVYADFDQFSISFGDVEAFAASLGAYDAATRRLSVEGVEFDLNDRADVALFAELAFVHSLIAKLKTDEQLKALVADKASDFFTFAVSLYGIERKYGADSAQARAAASILTTTISFATESIDALYNGRSMAEIVSASRASRPSEELLQNVQSSVAASSQLFFDQKVYPQVYSLNWLSEGEGEAQALCAQLSASLAQFEVFCADGAASALAVARFTENEEVVRMTLLSNGTDDGGATSEDIAIFQIVIWTSVMLIFAALAASIVMATVHDTSDSVIYNSPALHPKSA